MPTSSGLRRIVVLIESPPARPRRSQLGLVIVAVEDAHQRDCEPAPDQRVHGGAPAEPQRGRRCECECMLTSIGGTLLRVQGTFHAQREGGSRVRRVGFSSGGGTLAQPVPCTLWLSHPVPCTLAQPRGHGGYRLGEPQGTGYRLGEPEAHQPWRKGHEATHRDGAWSEVRLG